MRGAKGHSLPDQKRSERRDHGANEVPLRRRSLHWTATLCVTACKKAKMRYPGASIAVARRHHQRGQAGRALDLDGLHALQPTSLAQPSARPTASFPLMTASSSTIRISASAAATAFAPVPSGRRNIRRSAISAHAARWTNAPTAPAAAFGPEATGSIRGISQVWLEPLRRGQAADVRRDVLDQIAPRG